MESLKVEVAANDPARSLLGKDRNIPNLNETALMVNDVDQPVTPGKVQYSRQQPDGYMLIGAAGLAETNVETP